MVEQSNEVKTLAIIGNGFDLSCGLNSGFKSFFDSLGINFSNIDSLLKSGRKLYIKKIDEGGKEDDQEIDFNYYNLRTISGDDRLSLELSEKSEFANFNNVELRNAGFWISYLDILKEYTADWNDIVLEENTTNWYDIENILTDFFSKKVNIVPSANDDGMNNGYTRFEAIIEYFNDLKKSKKTNHRHDPTDENDDFITTICCFLLLNVFEYELDDDLSEFLLNQLKIFEKKLNNYLTRQLLTNTFYKSEAMDKISMITHDDSYNLINFNYTNVYTDKVVAAKNVHSTLNHGPIIGIDSDKVSATKSFYKFTKTYRTMRLTGNNVNQELFPDTVDKIVFYGHSLSQSDYSYFQSIFDIYDIYNNNITLEFYYSDYDGCKLDEASGIQFDRVSRLMDSYGNTIPNHGKNLLPKMLLEGRIKILRV